MTGELYIDAGIPRDKRERVYPIILYSVSWDARWMWVIEITALFGTKFGHFYELSNY